MSEQTEATAMEEQTATTKKAKALATDTLAILLVFALTFAALTYWFGSANAQEGSSTDGTDDAGTATAAQEPEYKVELVERQRGTADADGDGTADELVGFAQGKTLMPVTVEEVMDKDELDLFGLPTADNYVDKIVTAKNAGTENAYIRIIVAVPAALDDLEGFHLDFGNRFDESKQGYWNEGDSESPYRTGFTTKDGLAYETVRVTIDQVPYKVNENTDSAVIGEEYNLYVFTSVDAIKSEESTPAAIVGMYLDKSVAYDASTDTYSNGKGDLSGTKLSEYLAIPVIAQVSSAEFPQVSDINWGMWISDALSTENEGESLDDKYTKQPTN